jgi:hypothetical protein
VAPINNALQSILTYAFVSRAISNINEPYGQISPFSGQIKVGDYTLSINAGAKAPTSVTGKGDAQLREWMELLLKATKPGETGMQDAAFREALMRRLAPPTPEKQSRSAPGRQPDQGTRESSQAHGLAH